MGDPMEAAYEAAARALHERYHRGWTSCADNLDAHMGWARELTRAAVDAARPPLIAEGRRQAVEAIRARVGDIAAVEWAALIVEEEGRG